MNPLKFRFGKKSQSLLQRTVLSHRKNDRRLVVEKLESRRYLAGDLWTQRGGDAGRDGYVDTTIDLSNLNHLWTSQDAEGSLGRYRMEVAVDNDRVYQTQYTGLTDSNYSYFRVFAMSRTTGAELWSTQIKSHGGSVTAPTISNGRVYVNAAGHSQGLILNPADERMPKLYSLDAASGQVLSTAIYAYQWGSRERPVVAGNRLISEDGFYGGLASFDATSMTRQWAGLGLQRAPDSVIGTHFVYAYDNFAFNPNNGLAQYIPHPDSAITLQDPIVSGSGRVIFSTNKGISAYDGATNTHLWSTTLWPTRHPFNVVSVGNGIIAVGVENQLHLLQESGGALLGTWTNDIGRTNNEVILTNTHAFVHSYTGSSFRIQAINLQTFAEDWRMDNPGYVSMAILDNQLVLSSDTAVTVFAVGAPNNPPVVQNENLGIAEDGTASLNVLANDTDLDRHPLIVSSIGTPSHGTARILANGLIEYIPNANYFGLDEFTYVVDDAHGGTTTGTVQVTIAAVNDPPIATNQRIGGSEDVGMSGNFQAIDVDGDTLTYAINSTTAHGTLTFDSTAGSWSYIPSANFFGDDAFVFTANDGIVQSQPATVTLNIAAVNDIPSALISNAPTSGTEGTAISLSGVASDIETPSDSLLLSWNITKDGSPYAAFLGTAINFTPSDNGSYVVSFTADDGSGGIQTDSRTIQVANVAPAVGLSGPSAALVGQSLLVNSLVSDPAGASDPLVSTWRLTKDGVILSTTTNTLSSYSFIPTSAGMYVVTLSVDDGDGGTTVRSHAIVVSSSVRLNGGILTIDGTSAPDTIQISLVGTQLVVSASFLPSPTAFISSSVTSILIMSGDGNDNVTILANINQPATVYGESGNDTIFGGNGRDAIYGGAGNDILNGRAGNDRLVGGDGDDQLTGDAGMDLLFGDRGDDQLLGGIDADILVGGDGNDTLLGGSGNDLLIGGNGTDVLLGSDGDDLLVGSRTSYDSNEVALTAIMSEWNSTRSYASRVANILGIGSSNRANGNYFLKKNTTVLNDGTADRLSGQGNRDWFFAFSLDSTPDRSADETRT